MRDLVQQTIDQVKSLQDKLLEATLQAVTQRNSELTIQVAASRDESESYSRKDCLRINGIPIAEGENNETLKVAVIKTLAENGVVISNADIFRLHRAGRPSPLNNFKKYLNNVNVPPVKIDPRDKTETAEVIVRFTNWAARSKVYALHYEKNLLIRVRCDLTKFRQDLLTTARLYLKDHNRRGYVYNNAECALVLKDPDSGRRLFFKSFAELKQIADGLGVDADLHKRQRRRDLVQPDQQPAIQA